MADLRAYQPAFTAGVLSPSLWSRVDLAKYGSGLKTAINLFVHAHGGISNRAGLEFIGEAADSTRAVRLIPFQFSTEQSYVLEFGQFTMRVYREGGVILDGPDAYELVTPYPASAVGELTFIQEADVMYICHENYAVQKLSRLADDNWTIAPVSFGPTIAPPATVTANARWKFRTGDTVNFGFRVSAVSAAGGQSAAAAQVLVSFQYENFDGRFIRISWAAVPGAVSYRVYRSDGSTGIVAITTATSADMPVNGSGAFVGDGTAIPAAPSGTSPPATPTGVTGTVEFGKEYTYVVSAISDANGEESLPSTEVTVNNDMSIRGNTNTVTWSAVAGASEYYIYRKDNGAYGYIGRSDGLTFVDENITADISTGPQDGFNPFNGAGNYPRCATFIEQRLGFASTKNEPQGVWLSQSASYENFGAASPAKASDAITFRIKAKQVNEIRSMIASRGLMLLTSGAEWIVTGDGQGSPITPTQIKIDNQGYRGSSRVQPIVVGNTVLFAQERGGVVRDFSYEFANDGFTGKDLTILARHLFEERSIIAWAYSQAPYSIVWAVLDDGALVSLTYMREHEVWAWTEHESAGGLFEDVVVIGEGTEDVPYFIVRRQVDGVWRRYIERMHTRMMADVRDAFFVDSGLTYAGAPATVIAGLDHLEGEDVVALADGNVVRGLTVSGGSITLPNAAAKVHVGLAMTASLQTLDLDLGNVQGLGTVQGRMKSVAEVTLRVEDTRGIWIGPDDGPRGDPKLVEYKQRSTEAWNEAIGLYTGDLRITPSWDWNTAGRVWIKQFDPLPMTILAIMPDVVIGR
jgi:hypothetical protein